VGDSERDSRRGREVVHSCQRVSMQPVSLVRAAVISLGEVSVRRERRPTAEEGVPKAVGGEAVASIVKCDWTTRRLGRRGLEDSGDVAVGAVWCCMVEKSSTCFRERGYLRAGR